MVSSVRLVGKVFDNVEVRSSNLYSENGNLHLNFYKHPFEALNPNWRERVKVISLKDAGQLAEKIAKETNLVVDVEKADLVSFKTEFMETRFSEEELVVALSLRIHGLEGVGHILSWLESKGYLVSREESFSFQKSVVTTYFYQRRIANGITEGQKGFIEYNLAPAIRAILDKSDGQFFDGFYRSSPLLSKESLALAVLIDGIQETDQKIRGCIDRKFREPIAFLQQFYRGNSGFEPIYLQHGNTIPSLYLQRASLLELIKKHFGKLDFDQGDFITGKPIGFLHIDKSALPFRVSLRQQSAL